MLIVSLDQTSTTFIHSVIHCAIYFDSYLQGWKKTLLIVSLDQTLFILSSLIVLFILTATYKDGRKHYWLSPLIRVSLTTFVHSVFHCAIYFDSYLQEWKKTLLIVSLDQSFLDNVCSFCLSLCYLSWQLLTSMEENITDCLPWPEFPWQRLFRYYTSRSAETLLLQRKLW
jgi:hypothetical protein